MILKFLFNTEMIWMIFMVILKNTVQIKKCKIQIIFDDMIADILSNKKLNTVVTELFIRGRKQNFSLVFVTQSYFAVPKKYQTKFYTLFHYENSRQIRASTHRI